MIEFKIQYDIFGCVFWPVGGDLFMKQRALVFVQPQTPDNFISVYVAGSLTIIELDDWIMQLWFSYDIVLYPSNFNRIASNDGYMYQGPDEAA